MNRPFASGTGLIVVVLAVVLFPHTADACENVSVDTEFGKVGTCVATCETPSLQEAIDCVDSGGTVDLRPSKAIAEAVLVHGKTVNLLGEYGTILTDDDIPAAAGMLGSCTAISCEALVTVEDGELATTDVVVEVSSMRAFAVRNGTLKLNSTRILTEFDRDDLKDYGASALMATSSSIELYEVEIRGAPPNYGVPKTPQIRLDSSQLDAARLTARDAEGGVLEAYGPSSVRLDESVIEDVTGVQAAFRNSSNGFGASALTIVHSVFENVSANQRAGEPASTAAIDWWGDVAVTDSTFVDVVSKSAPWAIYARNGSFDLERSTICRAVAAVDPVETTDTVVAAAVSVIVYPRSGQSALIVNNRFYDNEGALAVTVSNNDGDHAVEGPVVVAHNHFVGNRGANGSALVAAGYYAGAILFAHNVVSENLDLAPVSSNGPTSVLASSETGEELIASRNSWYANSPSRDPVALDPEAVTDDPLISPLTGHCTPDDSGAYMAEGRPSYYGATRDRGTVAGLDPKQDRDVVASDHDDSAPDLGAWGGPYATASEWDDPDTDLVPDLYDCDSSDDTFGSGLDDPPYDGIDQDCRSDDDYDADDDGFRPPLYASDAVADCDDTDARRAPDHEEIPGNGVDDDCDGVADEWLPLEARGCSTVPGGASAAALALITVLHRRRREREAIARPRLPRCHAADAADVA